MHTVLQHARNNVVAYIALFVALGGSSYAASRLPGNSVGARQISTNAVGASEIRQSAVGSSELRKGAVRADDMGADSVGAASVQDNSIGSAEVQDNSIGSAEVHDISLPDLNFRPLLPGDVTGVGSTRTNEVTIAAGDGFASVHDISVPTGPRGDRSLLSATLEVTNPNDGNGAIQVNLRISHNGVIHHGTFSQTLQDGETATLPQYMLCDDAPGANDFNLEVEGVNGKGNLLIGDRSLQALIGLL